MPAIGLRPLCAAMGATALTAVSLCSCAPAASPASAHPGNRATTATPRAAGASSQPRGASPSAVSSDPPTVHALLRIAQAFNNNYDNGNFGAVYDRWDARSQAIISRSEYILRHQACAPATHAVARVEDATRGPHGAWLVSYRINGVTLVDTWYYVRHRWVFDIVRSNPSAARQYGLSFSRYAAAVGCTVH